MARRFQLFFRFRNAGVPEQLVAQTFVIPALRKGREGRGTHSVGDARPLYWLMSVTTFRFSALTWGRNYDRREIAFRGQLSESGQIMLLQVIPAAEQISALPFQLLELKLLGFGGG